MGVTSCGPDRAAAAGPLTGGERSLEALGEAVVEGLAAGDTAPLQRLRLTEREHNELVYPRLPAARPPRSFPVDVAWANIRTRNGVALARLLGRYAGTGVRFEAVECRGDTERFEGFEVLTDCRVRLRTAAGQRQERQLFRHVLVWNGRHKIFRYYD